ncbi:unnamed protein product [Strongylus vulgaris]|uniref:CRAL-TRIO domain-containing protein n=1 Tax=Strongylus vulgaris TaxID=40348 RepID=A0A3P7K192_STRVU|nr:unnamed protein product [Strongylus vulgaris]
MTISSGITPDEKQKIAELRKFVKDDLTEYYDTDFNLLRWLQGHGQLTIPEIARKLRHHLKTRKSTWDLDNVHNKERTHPIHNHWKYGVTGLSGTLENVIVNIEQCGRTDYNGMMECFSISEFFVPVNLPSFAIAFWTIVRPLLPERTKNKVRILSSSNWKDEILQFTSIDALPSIWNDDAHTFPAHIEVPQPYPRDMYYSNKGIKVCLALFSQLF